MWKIAPELRGCYVICPKSAKRAFAQNGQKRAFAQKVQKRAFAQKMLKQKKKLPKLKIILSVFQGLKIKFQLNQNL